MTRITNRALRRAAPSALLLLPALLSGCFVSDGSPEQPLAVAADYLGAYTLSGDRMIMVQGMPQVDPEWIASLEAESAHDLVRERDTLIEARSFEFRCGCTAERLIEALLGMWGKQPDELFQGDAGVEISCPRCGARWWIDREGFDTELLRRQAGPKAD